MFHNLLQPKKAYSTIDLESARGCVPPLFKRAFFSLIVCAAVSGISGRLNKNAYSTIDLSARRSAQMGINMKKAGIVIINFNSMNYLRITLESLFRAETNIAYSVGVIDNGSSEQERNGCKDFIAQMQSAHEGTIIKFYDAGKNLGFSGGNNVVIKDFLSDPEITHICLLNSDVIVTDHWLDYLLDKDKDVIGPVTNAAGNEQTVQIDYTINHTDKNAFSVVNDYAQKRHACYMDYVVGSDLVTFFATVFKREVIETVGLLDEQFYPGSYEDDDYCMRVLQAGYHIAIARDCFLHHFGSGSFSNLNMEDRKSIGNINRERFEKKWNTHWEERTWKLLESCKQDMDFLLKKENQDWARRQIDSSIKEIESLIADWGNAIQFFTTQAENAKATVYNYSAKQLISMLWEKVKRKFHILNNTRKQKTEKKLHDKENRQTEKAGMEKIYRLLDEAKKNGHRPICVFAPMYNRENEKDGYVQRIKAIDTTALNDLCRIYLYDEGSDCLVMRFDFIDPLHGYIVFNSHDKENLCEITKLVQYCGMTYTHSLLRFMEDRSSKELWNIFDLEHVKHFWDMHGTVPEEYELSDSPLGCQLANNIEKILAEKADVVVVVTHAMGRHLLKKYPSMSAEIVVVPIFTKELLETVPWEKQSSKNGLSVVYAGGTQPWQNIGLMQDIIRATQDKYSYKMFVPNPEEFWSLWGDRPRGTGLSVESKTPQELYEEYKSCDLGFILRDPGPVNYVACPTKVIEYLKYGIIPVLKSTEIGDFVDMGMNYIPYTDLMNGLKLSEQDRKSMAEKNYLILEKLIRTSMDGIKSLEEAFLLQDKTPSPKQIVQKGEKPVIGIVVTTFDKGGLEQVVLNLYLGYRKHGYQVYMLCQENILGIMAAQVAEGELLVFHNDLGTFLNCLYEKNITLLHYHYNVFGCKEAKARGVHTIYTMHNVYTWKSDSEILEYSKVLDGMDKIIPVSNLVKNYYLARTGADDENLHVIYNGIDFHELAEDTLPDYLTKNALGLAETDIVIAFVASFYPVKYQIGMIGVMEKLTARCPHVKLLYVGNSENGYYQEFLKEYNNSSAQAAIQVVPYFEHKYMGAFLRQTVDIFTLPTLQEGCSNAVLEAIYCDKPMVLTNVGNAMDVNYLKSCEVVPAAYRDVVTTSNEQMLQISTHKDSSNQKELVDAFAKVIENLESYKQEARISADAKKVYETESMIRQYLDIIKEVTA